MKTLPDNKPQFPSDVEPSYPVATASEVLFEWLVKAGLIDGRPYR